MSTATPNPNDPNRAKQTDANANAQDATAARAANERAETTPDPDQSEIEEQMPAGQKKFPSWLIWIGLAILAFALIWGFRSCSDDSDEQPTSPTAEATATAAESPAAEQENPDTATEEVTEDAPATSTN